MSNEQRKTLEEICKHINKMDAAQRKRVIQMTEAILFLKEAKQN